MTDAELNERIAGLLGWKRHETIDDVWIDPSHGGTASRRGLPNFLAPERFHKLIALAETLRPASLTLRRLEWADGMFHFHAALDVDAGMFEDTSTRSLSHALAPAIVAASEKKG